MLARAWRKLNLTFSLKWIYAQDFPPHHPVMAYLIRRFLEVTGGLGKSGMDDPINR